jgi:hypothetical protein
VHPVELEPFWDTENVLLAVVFGIGLLVIVGNLGAAIYWYNTRYTKRVEYESI